MGQPSIHSLDEIGSERRIAVIERARSIFWETAQQTEFSAQEDREAYEWCYFGYFIDAEPSAFFVAVGPGATKDVLGYICGVSNTRNHPELYRASPHIAVFDDLYDLYPAHLHINLTAASRGMGLGGALIRALESRLRRVGAVGLHLVTSPGARNVDFYHHNGFIDRYERSAPGDPDSKMLLMGKSFEE